MVEKVHNRIPGGRARGREVKHYLLQFAQIFSNFRPRCGDFVNYKQFAAYVQINLDKPRSSGYNGAGTTLIRRRTTTLAHGGVKIVVALLLAQED